MEVGTPSDIWISAPPLIMQGPCAEERERAAGPGPAVEVPGARRPVPAEVLSARVRAVTVPIAASRRGRMRRLGGCGCMRTSPDHGSPPGTGCTHGLTLCRGVRGRALGRPIVGF